MMNPSHVEKIEDAISTLENALQRLASPKRCNGVAEEQIEETIASLQMVVDSK